MSQGVQSPINGNLSVPVVMHTGKMQWKASPSQTVRRKRLHLVGEVESGQVTSLVKFAPNSSFPAHVHQQVYYEGDWIRLPTDTRHFVQTTEGSLYVKLNAVSQLNSG